MLVSINIVEEVFKRWAEEKLLLVAARGNVGDKIILRATEQLFYRYGISFVTVPGETFDLAKLEGITVVCWAGGGNMGTLYPAEKKTRERWLDAAKTAGLKTVILPQSWTSEDNYSADEVYAREQYSINAFRPDAKLLPDLGLYWSPSDARFSALPALLHRQACGYFFRTDTESTGRTIAGSTDPASVCKTAVEYFNLAGHYKVIHTDRLHFCVAALIAGTKVFFYPNSYFKNKAVYEAWLTGKHNCVFVPEEAAQHV